MVKDLLQSTKDFMQFKENLLNERGCCQVCGSEKNLMVYFSDAEAKNKLIDKKSLLLCSRCYNLNNPTSEAGELLTIQNKLNRAVYLREIR